MDFVPGEHTIIIGRGRTVKQHIANVRFDRMVAEIAHDYSAAMCKSEKGMILTRLINRIHDQGPNAGFVKKDPVTGRWCAVDESLARTTAAQAIRNFLHGQYRSSKQFKSKRRMEQIKAASGSGSGSEDNRDASASNSTHHRQFHFQHQQQNNSGNNSHANTDDASSCTRCVSPSESDCDYHPSINAVPQYTTTGNVSRCNSRNTQNNKKEDTFTILLEAFGNKVTEDPFSPTPLAEAMYQPACSNNNNQNQTGFFWETSCSAEQQQQHQLDGPGIASLLAGVDSEMISSFFQV
jgi:hypothetical protein